MKISTLVKKLNELKKKHGDIPVSLDLASAQFVEDQYLLDEGTVSELKISGVAPSISNENSERQYAHVILRTIVGKPAFTGEELV